MIDINGILALKKGYEKEIEYYDSIKHQSLSAANKILLLKRVVKDLEKLIK